jgi:hypothetical protein
LGAWAVALLLHGAGDDALLTDFYPRLDALGWDGAFEATFGRSAASFEEEFARFLRQPLDAQLKVVPDL